MKPFVVIFSLALGIQGTMSENDIRGDGCVVPAICKRLGHIGTAWMPISRPVCEADIGLKRTKVEAGHKGEIGLAGPQGEDGQQGEVGEAGAKGENGVRGENGSKGQVGAKGKGIKGGIGPKGEPANVDSLVFKNIIKVLCPVKHENKCFFPVIGREVNYDGGVAICEGRGGHLANIYSQTHMDNVMKYIRENRMEDTQALFFVLGMKYDKKATKTTLRDGSDAPAGLKWYSGYPYTGVGHDDWTSVILAIKSDKSSLEQYLAGQPPSHGYSVLCEFE